jgi:hypothetical protein
MAKIRIDTKDAGLLTRGLIRQFLRMNPESYEDEHLIVELVVDQWVECSDGILADGIPYRGDVHLTVGQYGLTLTTTNTEAVDQTIDEYLTA